MHFFHAWARRIVKWGGSLAVRNDGPQRALERLRALRTPLPEGFRFDRDEANTR